MICTKFSKNIDKKDLISLRESGQTPERSCCLNWNLKNEQELMKAGVGHFSQKSLIVLCRVREVRNMKCSQELIVQDTLEWQMWVEAKEEKEGYSGRQGPVHEELWWKRFCPVSNGDILKNFWYVVTISDF